MGTFSSTFSQHSKGGLISSIIPASNDLLFWLDGTIVDVSGTKYFVDKSGHGRKFLITGYDFDTSWTKGFPYKSAATISAPIGDMTLISADINNFLYTGGTPNQIPVVSLFQDIDYEHKIFTRHGAQVLDGNQVETYEPRVLDIVMYSSVRSGNALIACQSYFGVPAEITSNVIWVSKTGNDTTGTGSKAAPWLTINKAVVAATASDTIYIKSGTYIEERDGSNRYLYVDKTLTFYGVGKNILRSIDTTRVVRNISGNQIWHNFFFDGEGTTANVIQAHSSGGKTTTYNKCMFRGGTQYLYLGSGVETSTLSKCLLLGTASVTATQEVFGYTASIDSCFINDAEVRPLINSVIRNSKWYSNTKVNCVQCSNITLDFIGNTLTYTKSGVVSTTNTSVKNFNITYNTFRQGNAASTASFGVNLGGGANAVIRYNSFINETVTLAASSSEYFINITPDQAVPPIIEYNILKSVTKSIFRHIRLIGTVPIGAAKINYNHIENNTTATSFTLTLNEEMPNPNIWDGTEIIGNRIIGYKANYPAESSGVGIHSILANGGVNMNISYNYISHTMWALVVKSGNQGTYTSGGVHHNLVEDSVNSIWFAGIAGINCFNNTIRHSSTIYGADFQRAFNAIANSSVAGSPTSENIIFKNNIVDIKRNVGTLVFFDAHAASTGSVVSDGVWYGGQYKVTVDATTYATLATAQSAGWMASSTEADPNLTNLIPSVPISGIDLGASYNTGLDTSTTFGSLTTTPDIVTRLQSTIWQQGAYVQ